MIQEACTRPVEVLMTTILRSRRPGGSCKTCRYQYQFELGTRWQLMQSAVNAATASKSTACPSVRTSSRHLANRSLCYGRFNLRKSTIPDDILCPKEVSKPIGGSSLLCFGDSSLLLLVRAPVNRDHHSFDKYFSVFGRLLDLSTVIVTCIKFSNCTDSLH